MYVTLRLAGWVFTHFACHLRKSRAASEANETVHELRQREREREQEWDRLGSLNHYEQIPEWNIQSGYPVRSKEISSY